MAVVGIASDTAVRKVRAADAAALVPLFEQFGYPATRGDVRRRLARLAQGGETAVLVAHRDGVVIGVGALHAMAILEGDSSLGVIIALIVDEGVRRQGVGAALVAGLEEEARARGCFAIVVHSGARRIESHTFYKHIGYDQTGARLLKVFPPVPA